MHSRSRFQLSPFRVERPSVEVDNTLNMLPCLYFELAHRTQLIHH